MISTASIKSIAAGTIYGLIGLLVSAPFFLNATGDGWRPMIFYSGLAAFLTGTFVWRVFCAGGPAVSVRKGVGIGAAVGLLAHPIAWYLFILHGYFSGRTSSLGESTMNPLQAIPGALIFSMWSWLLAGWLTVPAGALAGGLWARKAEETRTEIKPPRI